MIHQRYRHTTQPTAPVAARRSPLLFAMGWLAAGLAFAAAAPAASVPTAGEMEQRLAAFDRWREQADLGFRLRYQEIDKVSSVAVYARALDTPFDSVTTALSDPAGWCGVLFLHLNVKACTHNGASAGDALTLFMGRKHYEPPEEARELTLSFQSQMKDDGVFTVRLYAEEGPYGTDGYALTMNAIEAGDDTYLEFHSTEEVGVLAEKAIALYLRTVGSDKVGFSETGTGEDGKPAYVAGRQGMLERNLVRYLLGLKVYVPTAAQTGPEATMSRAAAWFDATEEYARQLHEESRNSYLAAKRQEYANQVKLQAERDRAEDPVFE